MKKVKQDKNSVKFTSSAAACLDSEIPKANTEVPT